MLATLAACSSSPRLPAAHNDGPPQRIVSMNPCVDAILREIADPQQIAAVSIYSHDPQGSPVPLTWSQRYPAVSGAAEDVIAMKPDLVISGQHVAPQTVGALKRLGISLLPIPVPDSVEASKAQVMEIAARIGREQQGRALVGRIDAAMAQAAPPKSADAARAPSALIWQDTGLVPGPGTLANELLGHAGFRNAGADMGLLQWNIVPLEDLILDPPSLLLTGKAGMATGSSGQGNRILNHPVLRKMRGRMTIADYPSTLLYCGGPVIIPAVERLAAIRDDWLKTHRQ